jgi:hypothetical protein
MVVSWDREDKKYLQNFDEEVSWKPVSFIEVVLGQFCAEPSSSVATELIGYGSKLCRSAVTFVHSSILIVLFIYKL